MITVVELPEFIRTATALFRQEELDRLIYFLSANPKAGKVIPGTGGIRKLRWASRGKGKSGGSRVIYFFYNESCPLFLLTIFSKSEKVDLNPRERINLARLTESLIEQYKA